MSVKQIENYLKGKNIDKPTDIPLLFEEEDTTPSTLTLHRIVESSSISREHSECSSSSTSSINSSMNSSFKNVHINDCLYDCSSESSECVSIDEQRLHLDHDGDILNTEVPD